MADATGPTSASLANARALAAALTDQPRAFDFFFALRVLECLRPDLPRLGTAPRPTWEQVRLGQTPSMAFATSTLASCNPPDAEHDVYKLSTLFFGVFGANGPLPTHLTEHALQRRHNNHDGTLAAFADVFHHRMLSLLYRAWAQAQPTVQADRGGSDRFSTYVASLAGMGLDVHRGRDRVPDPFKRYFSGHYAAGVRHVDGLLALVRRRFAVPVEVQECIGEWVELPPDQGFRLGGIGRRGATSRLGRGAVLGQRVWMTQHKFRLVLGPLSLQDYQDFLSDGRKLGPLVDLVTGYVGVGLSWDVQLRLDRAERTPLRLGAGHRLGRASWLLRDGGAVVQDLIFDPARSGAPDAPLENGASHV